MIIRQAKKEDINILTQMNHEFQLSEKKVSDKFMRITPIANLKKRISNHLQKRNVIFLIAEENKKPIGFAKGIIESYKEDYEGLNKIGFATITYVKKKYRRMKVGTQLLDAMIHEFMLRKVEMITAFVHASNKGAVDFVHKKGFKIHSYELRKFC